MHVLHLGEGRWGCVGVPRMLRPDLSALSVGAVGAGVGAGWSAPPGRLRLADSDSCPHCDEVHAPDAACIGITFKSTASALKTVAEQYAALQTEITGLQSLINSNIDKQKQSMLKSLDSNTARTGYAEVIVYAQTVIKHTKQLITTQTALDQKGLEYRKLQDNLNASTAKANAKSDAKTETAEKLGSQKKSVFGRKGKKEQPTPAPPAGAEAPPAQAATPEAVQPPEAEAAAAAPPP